MFYLLSVDMRRACLTMAAVLFPVAAALVTVAALTTSAAQAARQDQPTIKVRQDTLQALNILVTQTRLQCE